MKFFLKSCLALLCFSITVLIAQEAPNYTFSGRYLLALSDTDMVATAYIDNALGERTPGVNDTLTVIPLPNNFYTQGLGNRANPVGQVEVSNCICNVADSMVVTNDGEMVYVIERKGSPAADITQYDQLPTGQTLRAVSLADPLQPKVVQELTVGTDPEMLSVSPDNTLLALPTAEASKRLQMVPLEAEGRLGTPQDLTFPGLPDDAFVTNLAWHPSSRFIAVNVPLVNQVWFYEVRRSERGEVSLTQWGEPVSVGKFAGSGYFTPDGAFFISNVLQWGTDVEGFFINPATGQLQATRFVSEGDAATIQHELVSTVEVGQSPETLRISPDGSLIVTANMRGSGLLWNDARMTQQSSMSLVTLDTETGQLATVGEYFFDGVLPQGLQFDMTGEALAVTLSDHFDLTQRRGAVEFWRVIKGETPSLERTGFVASVARGAYQLVLIK